MCSIKSCYITSETVTQCWAIFREQWNVSYWSVQEAGTEVQGYQGQYNQLWDMRNLGSWEPMTEYRGLCSAEQPYYSGGICSSPPPPPNREVFVCLPSLFELHRIQGWVWTQMRVECELNFLGLVIRLGEWAISCLEKHNGLKWLIAGKWLMIFIKRHTG